MKMPVEQTSLANHIDASTDKAQLDEIAKRLLKHKIILAFILKECVEEFKEYNITTIENKCITGEILLNQVPVDQDVENVDADSTIVSADTEDTSHNEGLVRFDIVFDAFVPKTGELIGVIINLEIQAKLDRDNPLVCRAIYYLARLISRQKGTIFTKSDYGKIRKVYSIWICPNPGEKNRNSMAEYGFTQRKVFGNINEPRKNYDKMTGLIINLGKEETDGQPDIIRFLSTLLSTTESVERRKEILENEYHIPMTREIKEDIQEMGSFGMAVQKYGEEIGQKIGQQIGQAEVVISIMRKHNLTCEEAMEFSDIDIDSRPIIAATVKKLLEEQKAG